jgi:hypothetical protein
MIRIELLIVMFQPFILANSVIIAQPDKMDASSSKRSEAARAFFWQQAINFKVVGLFHSGASSIVLREGFL